MVFGDGGIPEHPENNNRSRDRQEPTTNLTHIYGINTQTPGIVNGKCERLYRVFGQIGESKMPALQNQRPVTSFFHIVTLLDTMFLPTRFHEHILNPLQLQTQRSQKVQAGTT